MKTKKLPDSFSSFYRYLFFITIIFYFLIYIFLIKPFANNSSSFKTIPLINEEKSFHGYTLLAPYNRVINAEASSGGKIYLVDLLGNKVHLWSTTKQPFYAQLKKNGNLLVAMESPRYSRPLPPGGNTGTIQELDWNSKVIWEYKNETMHHDFINLPNGNILLSLWEEVPGDIASKIKGGVENTTLNGEIFSDRLVEINPQGKIVWEWSASKHLDPEIDILGNGMPRFAWTYVNGLSYTAHNSLDNSEAILVSMRSLDRVIMIRKKDGQIIWRSPEKMLNTQHDPSFLENGNILIFDNGFTREPNPFPHFGSRIVEIDPRNNQIVWSLDAGSGVIDKISFFSPIVGGAQRLPNGNTLITDGTRGHLFEVTKDKKLVWDMLSPYYTKQTGLFPNNFLFKTRRYSESEINWPEKLPSSFPLSKLQLSLYQLLNPLPGN